MKYLDLYSIISKPWLSTSEIMQVAYCCRNSAIKIRTSIENKVLELGKSIPNANPKVVPTEMVLDYLNLDSDYIYKMALREKSINESGVSYGGKAS